MVGDQLHSSLDFCVVLLCRFPLVSTQSYNLMTASLIQVDESAICRKTTAKLVSPVSIGIMTIVYYCYFYVSQFLSTQMNRFCEIESWWILSWHSNNKWCQLLARHWSSRMYSNSRLCHQERIPQQQPAAKLMKCMESCIPNEDWERTSV